MLIANNHVWFVEKTCKHFCDFLQSETVTYAENFHGGISLSGIW